jgi:hypothetical protein
MKLRKENTIMTKTITWLTSALVVTALAHANSARADHFVCCGDPSKIIKWPSAERGPDLQDDEQLGSLE